MPSAVTVSKHELLASLLRHSSVFVTLDGRAPGVELPEWLRADAAVVLQLGYDLAIPIPDLAIDERGFSATLSFRRVPFAVRVPWAAVFAFADDEGHQAVFPEDVPADLAAPAPPGDADAVAPAPADAATPAGSAPGKPPRPSHLKLVK
jgi:hypothetical protein